MIFLFRVFSPSDYPCITIRSCFIRLWLLEMCCEVFVVLVMCQPVLIPGDTQSSSKQHKVILTVPDTHLIILSNCKGFSQAHQPEIQWSVCSALDPSAHQLQHLPLQPNRQSNRGELAGKNKNVILWASIYPQKQWWNTSPINIGPWGPLFM